jgi:hypothetical protein
VTILPQPSSSRKIKVSVKQISQHLNPERFIARKIQMNNNFLLFVGEKDTLPEYQKSSKKGVIDGKYAIVVYKTTFY